jgi:hypothetical protein
VLRVSIFLSTLPEATERGYDPKVPYELGLQFMATDVDNIPKALEITYQIAGAPPDEEPACAPRYLPIAVKYRQRGRRPLRQGDVVVVDPGVKQAFHLKGMNWAQLQPTPAWAR